MGLTDAFREIGFEEYTKRFETELHENINNKFNELDKDLSANDDHHAHPRDESLKDVLVPCSKALEKTLGDEKVQEAFEKWSKRLGAANRRGVPIHPLISKYAKSVVGYTRSFIGRSKSNDLVPLAEVMADSRVLEISMKSVGANELGVHNYTSDFVAGVLHMSERVDSENRLALFKALEKNDFLKNVFANKFSKDIDIINFFVKTFEDQDDNVVDGVLSSYKALADVNFTDEMRDHLLENDPRMLGIIPKYCKGGQGADLNSRNEL